MADETASILALIACVLIISTSGKENPNVAVSYWTGYENGSWVGEITCIFPDTTDCLFSMHFQEWMDQGNKYRVRRIDHDNHNSNEFLLVDCGGQDATVTLRVINMTYDYVQLYTCMQDNSQDTAWSWLIANPMLSMEGEMSLGSQITFKCVTFHTASIYWVFPGLNTDNTDIVLDEFDSGNNYTITATFQLQRKHNYAIIQCCMKLRDGQKTEQPCDEWRIVVDDSIQLVSTYENYQNFTRVMQCVFRSPSNDYLKILWFDCDTSGACADIGINNYDTSYDSLQQTLSTTAIMVDRGDHYICSYYGVNHTFTPEEQNFAPMLVSVNDNVTFNGAYAYAAEVTFDAYPPPTFQWTKTAVNQVQNGSTIIVQGEDFHCSYQVFQIGQYRYASVLAIANYYTPEDNNIYTFTASNSFGQMSVSVNTTKGPTAMNIAEVTGGTSCLFYGFPLPLPTTLRVLSPNEIEYSVEVRENLAQMLTNVTLMYSLTEADYPFSIDCCTFNQFNYDTRMCYSYNKDS